VIAAAMVLGVEAELTTLCRASVGRLQPRFLFIEARDVFDFRAFRRFRGSFVQEYELRQPLRSARSHFAAAFSAFARATTLRPINSILAFKAAVSNPAP